LDSAVSPLGVDPFYIDRHHQFRRPDIWRTLALGNLLAVTAALLASVQRSVHVCAALYRQAAQRVAATMKKATTMKTSKSLATKAKESTSPSRLIDGRIEELGDWRGETLARVRSLIKEACPDVVEEWKWRGVPVWEHAGIICTGETYKAVVKLTFAHGASLKDPAGLFNSSLEGNMRRAIDIHEDEKINERALKTLIRAAADYNQSKSKKKTPKA
jgi:hypothetical protein